MKVEIIPKRTKAANKKNIAAIGGNVSSTKFLMLVVQFISGGPL